MKKLLSVILATLMIVAAVPMAFAMDDAYVEDYVDEVIKLYIHGSDFYDNQDFKKEIRETYFVTIMGDKNSGFNIWCADTKEEIPEKFEKVKEINAQLESRIAAGEASVIIDTSAVMKAYITYAFVGNYYNTDIESMGIYMAENSEKGIEQLNSEWDQLLKIMNYGGATQAEFDALAEDITNLYNLAVIHAMGEHGSFRYENMGDGTHKAECTVCGNAEFSAHNFGEYISNNDATEHNDGTKTAVCGECDATDTVVDEGSMLVREPATFIEKIIDAIKSFFAKILAIFNF